MQTSSRCKRWTWAASAAAAPTPVRPCINATVQRQAPPLSLPLQHLSISPSKPPSHAGASAGVAIAEALHLNYVFLSEFEELHSPLRDALTQGGGVHGNAILSKFDIPEAAVVPHR